MAGERRGFVMTSRYQEWLKHVFDHEIEVQKPAWYFDLEAPSFNASPIELTALISQTFRCAGKDLVDYTDAQVNQGLWYLVSLSGSEYIKALQSPDVPINERLQAIGNIYYLYAECFARRCAKTLGHLDEEGSALNFICYMFWDECPLCYPDHVPDQSEIENAIFSVLQQTLTINHRACREGALHGLGHMFSSHPEKVRTIIDHLIKDAILDEKLLSYAHNAREGNVQ